MEVFGRRARGLGWGVGAAGLGLHPVWGGRVGRRTAPRGCTSAVRSVVFSLGGPVPIILVASAASVPSIRAGISGALGAARSALVRGTAGSPALVAAAARASAAAVAIGVVVAREAARGASLLRLHLIGGLAISLGKLDLDLAATNPFAVQVVQGIFGIAYVFKLAAGVKVLHLDKRFAAMVREGGVGVGCQGGGDYHLE